MASLMAMAQQVRDKMGAAQSAAGKVRGAGEAGGGMVRVVLNGQHEAVEVRIDPAALAAPADAKLLEDLVRAAINQAAAEVGRQLQQQLGGVAKDFGVDLGALEGMLRRP